MTTTLLVDSDIVAYKFASRAQTTYKWPGGGASLALEDFDDVTEKMDQWLADLEAKLKADETIICLSCPSSEGFRMNVLPTYKGNRKDVIKPEYLQPLKDYMRENYNVYERPTLEADDVMGILSTHPKLIPGKKIIVSEDKDMKTIPGWLYNPAKDTRPMLIPEDVADFWHMYQTLVGDATDNYKGCPGIGDKKALSLLRSLKGDSDEGPFFPVSLVWPHVVALFKKKGLTEEDALVQARVARICRASDYDFKKKEVILWNPLPTK